MPVMSEEEEADLHQKCPPLPGHKGHSCTDTACLVVFLSCFFIQLLIIRYAYDYGDIRKLTRGYNMQGELCGVDVPGDLLFHCRAAQGDLIMHEPICVDDCPRAGNMTHLCYSPVAGQYVEFPDYDTMQVLNYCVPSDWSGLKNFLKDKLGDATQALQAHKRIVQALKRMATTALAVVKRGWLALLIATNVSIIAGYIYLFLLDKVALHLVYACEIIVTAGSVGLGLVLIREAFSGGADNLPDTGDAFLDLGAGLILIILGCLAACISVCINRGLPTAIGCIEATCECMFQEPTLLLEPFVALAQKTALAYGYLYLLVALVGTGDLDVTSMHDGFQRSFHHSWLEKFMIAFTVLMFFWAMGISHALTQYALAWTTQMWYFTPYVDGEKLDRKPCAVFRAYCNAIRYHLGSIAIGGLCAVLFGLARVVLKPVAKAANMRNPISRFVALSCFFCIAWYWSFLIRLKKSAYMDIAITSSNFCPAAERSLEILANEVPALHVLSGAQFVFQVALLGIVCYTSFSVTLFLTKTLPMFAEPQGEYYLEDSTENLVAFFAAGVGFLVGFSFVLVFDTVGDTILYCFATEQRRHRELDQTRYREDNQQGFFGWLIYGEEDEEELEDSKRVDYAPQRLRALIGQGSVVESSSESDYE